MRAASETIPIEQRRKALPYKNVPDHFERVCQGPRKAGMA